MGITMNPPAVKLTGKYYKQLHPHQFYKLEEMEQYFGNHKLQLLNKIK